MNALPKILVVSWQGKRPDIQLTNFDKNAHALAKGGSGTVYQVHELPDSVIKLYHHQSEAADQFEKVRAMLERPPESVLTSRNGVKQLAWPEAIVKDNNGKFVGFVMPFIDVDHAWRLQAVVKPTQRHRKNIPDDLLMRLWIAGNLAAMLEGLHEAGHYVIDLKPQNVLVYDRPDARGFVAFIDCDGFQINGSDNRRYEAGMATPGYITPIAGKNIDGRASFSSESINDWPLQQDSFALAVIIFELLNESLHPYSGIQQSDSVPSELAVRALEHGKYYPYGRVQNPLISPHPDSIHHWFSRELNSLFERAFGGQMSPSPQEWRQCLSKFRQPEYECQKNKLHWKLGESCPFCEKERAQVPLPPRNQPKPAVSIPPTPPQRPVSVPQNIDPRTPIQFWLASLSIVMVIKFASSTFINSAALSLVLFVLLLVLPWFMGLADRERQALGLIPVPKLYLKFRISAIFLGLIILFSGLPVTQYFVSSPASEVIPKNQALAPLSTALPFDFEFKTKRGALIYKYPEDNSNEDVRQVNTDEIFVADRKINNSNFLWFHIKNKNAFVKSTDIRLPELIEIAHSNKLLYKVRSTETDASSCKRTMTIYIYSDNKKFFDISFKKVSSDLAIYFSESCSDLREVDIVGVANSEILGTAFAKASLTDGLWKVRKTN
jgi:hypothetical protein